MSMTSDPTSVTLTTYATYADYIAGEGHKATEVTVLGDCYDTGGKRYSIYYDAGSHKCHCQRQDAQAAPTVVFEKFETWGGRPGADHFGHPLSHLGSVAAPKGTMDVYFCQKDKEICYDSKT